MSRRTIIFVTMAVFVAAGLMYLVRAMYGAGHQMKIPMVSHEGLGGGLTFRRPADWRMVEPTNEAGLRYHVQLIRLKEASEPMASSISIMVFPSSTEGGTFASLDEVVTDTIQKRQRFKEFQLLETGSRRCAGQPAKKLEMGYKWMVPLYSTQAKSLQVREQVVAFAFENAFYLIRYLDTSDGFSRFSPLFEEFLNSIRLKS